MSLSTFRIIETTVYEVEAADREQAEDIFLARGPDAESFAARDEAFKPRDTALRFCGVTDRSIEPIERPKGSDETDITPATKPKTGGELMVQRARDALRAGKRIRIRVGSGPESPVALLRRDEGMVTSIVIGGWSAGTIEPLCALDSDYLREVLERCESVKLLNDDEAAALAGWER